MGQYLEMSDELKSQTRCFVCDREFPAGKYHLHHDHKREGNNIIGKACERCNLSMRNVDRVSQ